jgi:Ala-tRNA(Pro) deacylase
MVAHTTLQAAVAVAFGSVATTLLAADEAMTGPEAAALIAKEGPLLRALLGAGVRETTSQMAAYELAAKDATLQAVVARIEAVVLASGFLGGAAPGPADAAVAAQLYPVVTLLLPPSLGAHPAFASWFTATVSTPAFTAALASCRAATGGVKRIGGQVDARASPVIVSAKADEAIARNSGHKKAASQRDAEDAKKEGGAPPAHAPAPVTGLPTAVPAVAPAAVQPESNKTLPSKTPAERIAIAEESLRAAGVAGFTTHPHAAAATVDALLAALEGIAGARCKNLVVKAKKERAVGDSKLWLVVALTSTKVDLVDLAKRLGYGKTVIRFAEADAMLEHLGVAPGNATPLALANDKALTINVALDSAMLATAGPLLFHPLTNEASTGLTAADLLKFVAATGHAVTTVDFTTAAA